MSNMITWECVSESCYTWPSEAGETNTVVIRHRVPGGWLYKTMSISTIVGENYYTENVIFVSQ